MHRIEVRGVVQGVGFRPSVKRAADRIGATGYVRNDGSHVTILTDTDPSVLMEEIERTVGPMARIEEWTSEEVGEGHDIEGFGILSSTEGERDSSLPPDTAICDNCLSEMFDPEDRRYLYPFTNCTDCGARYTLIEGLPYDRERTAMSSFGMCSSCESEYSDMSERRFHAQTLSCPVQGPGYRYLDRDLGKVADGWRAFERCAHDILSGRIVIVKGWGGMHIVCDPSVLKRMREWYGRPFKPFAIMARNVETVREVAMLGPHEEDVLTSPARPIVLLRKKNDPPRHFREVLELASPGLDSVGLYLPYSGIHHLLFKALSDAGSDLRWFVMTSANPPGQPMALELEDTARMRADGYLVHDRRISARCDDSVMVPNPHGPERALARPGPFGMRAFPIRKARGLVPDPQDIPHNEKVLSLGAERNATVTVTRSGRAFTSPYLGNTRHPEVLDSTLRTAERFMDLFGAGEPSAVAVDLHPRYDTVRLGRELSEEWGVPLLRYQHHEVHAAALMVDSGIGAMPSIVIDGVGYGSDGRSWGGEVIDASWVNRKRVAHLEYFGLPGGDNAVFHPERIAHWLTLVSKKDLSIGDPEAERILRASHASAVMTSSMGRLLDAMSSLMLGVTRRTYDGEPAMRMERLLASSEEPNTEPFHVPTEGGRIDVIKRWGILLEELFGDERPSVGTIRADVRSADLAMGMVRSIIDDMVYSAVDRGTGDTDGEGRSYVGLSGGVAFDLPVVNAFVEACHEQGAFPVLHSRSPAGDGCISLGQAALAGLDLHQR